nr:DUF4760 domain-containing protein [Sphingosinicella soli]
MVETRGSRQGCSYSLWCWVGENSDAIQAICIVLSAIAAFLVIWHNGKISRRQATIQMVVQTFFDAGDNESYAQFKKVITDLEVSKQNIESLALDENSENPASKIILRQLNQYELISLSIRKGVFEENFYKYWFFTQFTRDYSKLFPYITKTREAYCNPAYFCEFETLAKRWLRKKHHVKHPSKVKRAYWSLVGKTEKLRQALDADGTSS